MVLLSVFSPLFCVFSSGEDFTGVSFKLNLTECFSQGKANLVDEEQTIPKPELSS
jgi:hypothetical protein